MPKLLGHNEGFEELRHASGWRMRVWAPDIAKLFSAAAQGTYALSGAKLARGPRLSRTFEARGTDTESLLVAFLSDLVFAAEQQKVGFDRFIVLVADGRVKVAMSGTPLESLARPISAVALHRPAIRHTRRGYEAEIAFDD